MRTRAAIFLGLYLGAIVYLTLFPWDFQFYARGQGLYWTPLTTRRAILDAVLNLLLFVPLGVAGFVAFGRRWWSAVVTIGIVALASWTIESLQLWTPGRFANLNDFASNTLGGSVGCAVAWGIERGGWWDHRSAHRHAARWGLTSVQALFVLLWLLWQAFPFIPAIALTRVRQFTEPAAWSWVTFGEVLVGAAVLRSMLGRSPWLLIAAVLLPAQAFLVERSLSYSALLGAGVGALGARAVGGKTRTVLAWGLSLWLVFEEFRPFTLAESVQPFAWEPFRSWYEVSTTRYYAGLFGKLFLYTAAVWSWREDRRGWGWAVGVPMAILAVGEWSQRYIAGRTPESTDVVVLAAGAVLLGLCSKRSS